MQSNPQPIAKDLVLIGGGHSHAIALKQFGMKPLPGVRLTLITDAAHTPYSGMLPGYVAGLYSFDDCHIDLRLLSQFAQTRMVVDRAIGLDLDNQFVICANRPPIAFDLLSIDIGSTPRVAAVPGALEYAIAVKPISKFLVQWQQVVDRVTQTPNQPIHIGIVGGGAGGVELAFSIRAHLQRIYQQVQPSHLHLHLFQRDDRLLPSQNRWVSDRVEQLLSRLGVHLYLKESVVEVQPDRLRCESGLEVKCDRIFWVTQAAAASWLRDAGLATDEHGFVQIKDTLQSTSHPQVFAAGDVATISHHPRPKAGVFAVRQGKPLSQNLRRALQNQPLHRFVPQKKYLILIGIGNESAIACRDAIGFGPHPLLWQWKDRIDRKFMQQFTHLEAMGSEKTGFLTSSSQSSPMRCGGCGAKISSTVLAKVLQRIQPEQPAQQEDILIGLDAPDDAAVIQIPGDRVLVQTIDYFRDLVDDPFQFGQIAANHCLNDLFAMGAMPQSALAIATLPYALESKQEETLYQLLSGAVRVLQTAQAALIGGHTTEGTELSFGLSCNGLIDPRHLLRKSGMKPGEVLILTKALGTGTLFAANMRLQAKGRWIEAAIASMLLSNQSAAACFQHNQASACTDITGFGLLGHLAEMVQASQVAVELRLEAIAILEGVTATLEQGIVSSLYSQNLRAAAHLQNAEQFKSHPLYPLLFDPQTSGGLLASVSEERAIACLKALQDKGYPDSRVIGRVLPPQPGQPPITIK